MRVLVCGDLHCKPHLLQRALGCTKWDYFVFLGDACDNFGARQEDNLAIVRELIKAKEKYGSKFIWLIGNHDWGYYDESIGMSGHIQAGSANVNYLLKTYKNMWDFFWQQGKYVFSHAGIGVEFAESISETNYQEMKDNPGLNNPINQVGKACGGFSEAPSLIWARPQEITPLPEDLGIIQIVGHTPVEKISVINSLVVCDTMSQYPDGRFFGDQALLLIDGNMENGTATLKAINPETGRKKYGIELKNDNPTSGAKEHHRAAGAYSASIKGQSANTDGDSTGDKRNGKKHTSKKDTARGRSSVPNRKPRSSKSKTARK